MYRDQHIPEQIANTIDWKWFELNSLISPMRVEAIANICRQILDGLSSGPRISGDLSDKFTQLGDE